MESLKKSENCGLQGKPISRSPNLPTIEKPKMTILPKQAHSCKDCHVSQTRLFWYSLSRVSDPFNKR